VGERALDVEIEPELGQLHRHLAVEPAPDDLVENAEVVGRDLVRLLDPGQVLAEPRVERRDPVALEALAGVQRGGGVLAGHEPPDGPPGEPQPRHAIPEPAVTGHPEEEPSHRVDDP
jgi:hypothetical protein